MVELEGRRDQPNSWMDVLSVVEKEAKVRQCQIQWRGFEENPS